MTSTAIKVVLILNLMTVLAAVGIAAIAGIAGVLVVGGKREVAILVGAVLLGVAVTWLTVQCARAFDPRLAVAIFVLSIPSYLLYALTAQGQYGERRLATTFVTGDAASASSARAGLEGTGQRSGLRPAVPILLDALTTERDPAKRLATVELLGAISLYDAQVVSALVPLAKRDVAAGAPTELRIAAFVALRKVNQYAVDVTNVHYAGLTADGLATFRLPKGNPLYGDSVPVAIDGLVLPRARSSDACEVAMARKADSLIADTLARAQRVDLVDMRIASDGEYVAAVGRDGYYLHTLLAKELPAVELKSGATRSAATTTDWCKWSGTARRGK